MPQADPCRGIPKVCPMHCLGHQCTRTRQLAVYQHVKYNGPNSSSHHVTAANKAFPIQERRPRRKLTSNQPRMWPVASRNQCAASLESNVKLLPKPILQRRGLAIAPGHPPPIAVHNQAYMHVAYDMWAPRLALSIFLCHS